jgi:hypothetical protein
MPSYILTDLIIWIAAVVVVCTPFTIISLTRKVTPALRRKPKRTQNFRTNFPQSDTLRLITDAGVAARYRLEEIDPAGEYVILGKRISGWTWGFFFPVFLSTGSDGLTLVEVAIKSRAGQIGPIVTYNRNRFVKMLQEAVVRHGGALL